jgi:membrane protein implicated in regulation of membrane protease activity
MTAKICIICGMEISDDAIKCPRCGYQEKTNLGVFLILLKKYSALTFLLSAMIISLFVGSFYIKFIGWLIFIVSLYVALIRFKVVRENGRITAINLSGRRRIITGKLLEVKEPFPVHAILRFHYRDAWGARSERTVEVDRVASAANGNLLIGHCRLRNETRTFRVDRIEDCIDEENRQSVSDVYSYLWEKSKIHKKNNVAKADAVYVIRKDMYFKQDIAGDHQ